ncbi:STAS domain-containing protein [Quadrisphaera sp. DSM 44207]|uniref:STAS domain-containing protein n=1 Tax=Quadrisphaera sp. DSM 44207 TaxID=1881057 RepID=UPI0008873388|nr:STAS domain-containing protein [Quadrisphaera sp. DSM 44207]SDQ04520.1 anti-anti-sigma factor [Quadrisphaera sp. DSM 44207]
MRLEALPERRNGVRVLRAHGELDVTAAPAVLPGVPDLVADAAAVVLDLSALSFFDSAGVRLVDQLSRECTRSRAPFRVVAPPRTPSRRVLELVGLDALADDDLPAALRAVGGAVGSGGAGGA